MSMWKDKKIQMWIVTVQWSTVQWSTVQQKSQKQIKEMKKNGKISLKCNHESFDKTYLNIKL